MGFLPRMVLGIVLGAIYWFSGSLYLSILGHFIFNFITLLLMYFKVADLDTKTSSSAVFIFLGMLSLVIVVLPVEFAQEKINNYLCCRISSAE